MYSMEFNYFDIKKTSHLINEFYHLSYPDEVVPLESIILPLTFSGIAYIYTDGQKVIIDKDEIVIKNLIIYGQFNRSFKFSLTEKGFACGISFKATTLHKLTNLDVSKLTNKYLPFNSIDKDLSKKFEEIFINHKDDFENVLENLENFLLELPLIENKNTIAIDNVINIIQSKEGMISVTDLLENLPFGQKTLETQFKKMVGLTPAKYIRIHRFKKLMRAYESKEIDLKDLIYMYDYYDESHFAKDFKSFTSKSFKDYFKEEFSVIKGILKNSNYDYLQD